mmetsp:Transcript_16981/g.22030  ORF Transcript_16981/g.22030 Transcript_16981/m.22030 type:complete len:259 (+) Transcript_16981:447-1223(+)|eukprot:CAMPEP_0116064788 /NCGR_PEP_ID=MMETSP0322-20121206/9329_1 /TAXON_ID=163516 /ORGANISM="Leptocylindrus danicus var. apora, Strain B651" /LENGTH=258 /DNA_ID=CAMNT_0003550885 /DNA_START=281 /DNA_END=1057 /DNA_ORIENTATION=+
MGNCIASPDGLIVSSKDTLAPTVQSDNHSLVIPAEQRSVVKPSKQQPIKFDTPQPPLKPTAEEIERMLDVIEHEILPKTSQSVAEHGNKVFGAAVLSDDYKETIIAETNNEMACPLFHAEVHAIKQVCHVIPPGERGTEFAQSIFLSTHEPCCMCISSIVWAGYKKVYFFFPYEQTTAQGIPHDVDIMRELWGVNSYRRRNKFIATACIIKLVKDMEEGDVKKALRKRIISITRKYDELSKKYHSEKSQNSNNNLAFG